MTGPQKQTPGEVGTKSQASAKSEADAPIIDGSSVASNKSIANAKAQLALRGWVVHDSAAGGWFVVKWQYAIHCPSPEDLAAALKRIGGGA